jgi:serine/threonine protein kinase
MCAAEPGEVLAGRYRLQSVIRRSAIGDVWLATDELLHRDVEIRQTAWPPDADANERQALRQRALGEAQAVAHLNHPNVASVLDVIDHGGRPWTATQLFRCRALGDIVRDSGPLSTRITAEIGLRLLAAISAAHAVDVLHRDVRPENVLLGPERRVVLANFGLSVVTGSPSLTTSGVLVGSPAYIAPERARGERATPATDLWSLGATLYGTVEGRDPFARNGMMAVLTAIVTDDPDPPDRAGPLWPVISGLLRKDPWARLDAAETERLLRQVADGDAVSASEDLADGPHLLDPQATSPPEPERSLAEVRPRNPVRRLTSWPWLIGVVAGVLAAAGIALGLGASGTLGGGRGAIPAMSKPASSGPRSDVSSSASPGSGALPAGYVMYRDQSGFAIGVPVGWQISHEGHLVYVRPPSSGAFLLIDQTTHPQSNALADWREQEAARISTYPGYHRIRLEAVRYPQAQQAADWEFTYYRAGQLTRVLNRNILVDSHRAYALYWSTPASQWAADLHFFQAFAATFRPAR